MTLYFPCFWCLAVAQRADDFYSLRRSTLVAHVTIESLVFATSLLLLGQCFGIGGFPIAPEYYKIGRVPAVWISA